MLLFCGNVLYFITPLFLLFRWVRHYGQNSENWTIKNTKTSENQTVDHVVIHLLIFLCLSHGISQGTRQPFMGQVPILSGRGILDYFKTRRGILCDLKVCCDFKVSVIHCFYNWFIVLIILIVQMFANK